MPEPEAEDPIRPAYATVQTILTDPLRRNAERIDVAPVDGATAVKYVVDGVAYSGNQLDRAKAAAAIEYLKSMSGLDLNEKRKPQTGTMKVTLDGQKRDLQILTAGSTAGEQLRATVDPKKRHQHRLDDLGLSEDQLEVVRTVIQDGSGVC